MAFLNDIKSKHLSNFVLVTISQNTPMDIPLGTCVFGDINNPQSLETSFEACQNQYGGLWTPYSRPISYRISTKNITFDGEYYKPVLLNIPSISESLDIEQRKYKISSVSLNISDYEHNGIRFSDTLNTIINSEVNIYFSSPSCSNLDDCYLAGTYIVRSFSQDEDKVNLNCEDISQDKLHKDLPLQSLPDSENILEKYRNKPIPMVFGYVDRSPCVLNTLGVERLIVSDYNPDDNFAYSSEQISIGGGTDYQNSPLYIYENEAYVNIANKKPDSNSQQLSNNGTDNFTEDTGFITLESNIEGNDTINENLRIISVRKPTSVNAIIISNQGSDYDGEAYFKAFNMNNAKNNVNTYALLSGNTEAPQTEDDELFGSIDPRLSQEDDYYSMSFIVKFEDVSNINTSDIVLNDDGEAVDDFTWIYYKFRNQPDNNNNSVNPTWSIAVDATTPFDALFSSEASLLNSINGASDPVVANNFSITDAGKRVKIGYLTQSNPAMDELVYCKAKLYYIFLIHSAVIKGIEKYTFFTNTVGRKGVSANSQDIFSEILISELNFNPTLIQSQISDVELGQYAFTVDKKINSKKLIEELSKSTPLFPYFKNNEFKVKSIKTSYNNSDKVIKAKDVINYKFDRTKLEKVYTKVNVRYNYDYGLNDYTNETDYMTPDSLISIDDNYSIDFFGQNFDQEFVFESKYIRHQETAENLAKYLTGLHANQHNLITLTLPLNYLNLELGDIVEIDQLIQGRKLFGEDYTNNISRNGQLIYKYFFIERIKKSLDKVEVKLYQLHDFNFENAIVYGCTNISANNYNPSANTDDGSCTFPEAVEGCTYQDALNFDENANVNNNTCVFPQFILPPEITTPEDETIFQTEETAGEEETLGDNLIILPEKNSTFDENTSPVDNFHVQNMENGDYITGSYNTNTVMILVNYEPDEGAIEENPQLQGLLSSPSAWLQVKVQNLITNEVGDVVFAQLMDYNYEENSAAWFLKVMSQDDPASNLPIGIGDILLLSYKGIENSGWKPAWEYLQWDSAVNSISLWGFQSGVEYLTPAISQETAQFMSLHFTQNYTQGTTYRLQFNYRLKEPVWANYDVKFRLWDAESDTTEIMPIHQTPSTPSTEWQQYSDTLIAQDSGNYIQLFIDIVRTDSENTALTDYLIIDNITLKEVTQHASEGGLIYPTTNINWNLSDNLTQPISELNITPTGNYEIEITDPEENIIHSVQDISSGVSSMSLDFDAVNLPQNILLKLIVRAKSSFQYNGNYVFDSTEGGIPFVDSSPIYFSWGEPEGGFLSGEDIGAGFGDVNFDGIVNVVDILMIMGHILGTQEQLEGQALINADIVDDGVINVTDVVNLISLILGD